MAALQNYSLLSDGNMSNCILLSFHSDNLSNATGGGNCSLEVQEMIGRDDYIRYVMNTYRTRFGPYTAFCAICVLFNSLSLTAMTKIRGQRSVHHTLLMNLACCDMIGSVLLWMYYNSVTIFPRFEVTTVSQCLFIVMLAVPFILSLCCSSFSLLMLAVNQYIAICSPFFSATKVTRGRIIVCIITSWFLSAMLAMVPAFIMLFMTRFRLEHCREYVSRMSEKSLEVCAYVLAGVIVVITCLYGGIYKEIVNYRKRTPQLMSRRTRGNGDTETEHNYKAFITTLLLAGTLVVFWLPYMTYHLISMHLNIDNLPDIVWQVKFYVIDFLPMLNFVTDPIIYGIRMREIRVAYHRLFASLLPCCVDEPRRPIARASVRFSTLDTTTV